MSMPNRRAVVYVAWGDRHLSEARDSARSVRAHTRYDTILITDGTDDGSQEQDCAFGTIIRTAFALDGFFRKTEMFDLLPENYVSFCFLDTDTTLVTGIDQAFEKSERYGLAASQASHYSLEHFWGFGSELQRLGLGGRDLLQYNTGVLFFTRRPDAWAVLLKWNELCRSTPIVNPAWGKQPYLSLAMELLDFNPYTLTTNYNYRNMGDSVSGDIRIWHSHLPPPDDLNHYAVPWPPRRFLNGHRIEDDRLSSLLPTAANGAS